GRGRAGVRLLSTASAVSSGDGRRRSPSPSDPGSVGRCSARRALRTGTRRQEEVERSTHNVITRRALIPAAVMAGATLALTAVSTASAHVIQQFGAYSIAIGWLHEPTFASQQNAVQTLVKDAKGNPVDDLAGGDLKVQIVFGSQMSDTMPLNPTFDPDTGLGARGEYDATFTPTAPGDYTFHLTGNVHGTNVDQSFTSSDKTFDTVKDPTTIQFPAKVPAAADLSARIDRITPRLNDARS